MSNERCGNRYDEEWGKGKIATHICEKPKGHDDGLCEDIEMMWKPGAAPSAPQSTQTESVEKIAMRKADAEIARLNENVAQEVAKVGQSTQTAREFLRDNYPYIDNALLLEAMESYASSRVASLQREVEQLRAENERLIDAWLKDETIGITDGQDDGTVRPTVRATVARAALAESKVDLLERQLASRNRQE